MTVSFWNFASAVLKAICPNDCSLCLHWPEKWMDSCPNITLAISDPLEVTWRHLNWSQNTFRSVRENIIWSWNPFSKDVLQIVDLTLFFPPTFFSLIGPKALRGNRVTQIGRKRARKRRWRLREPAISNLLLQNVMPLFCPPPTLIFKWCHNSVDLLDCWKAFLCCWHCGSLNCDCCS